LPRRSDTRRADRLNSSRRERLPAVGGSFFWSVSRYRREPWPCRSCWRPGAVWPPCPLDRSRLAGRLVARNVTADTRPTVIAADRTGRRRWCAAGAATPEPPPERRRNSRPQVGPPPDPPPPRPPPPWASTRPAGTATATGSAPTTPRRRRVQRCDHGSLPGRSVRRAGDVVRSRKGPGEDCPGVPRKGRACHDMGHISALPCAARLRRNRGNASTTTSQRLHPRSHESTEVARRGREGVDPDGSAHSPAPHSVIPAWLRVSVVSLRCALHAADDSRVVVRAIKRDRSAAVP